MICDNLVGLRGRLPLHALRCHSVNYKKSMGIKGAGGCSQGLCGD